MSVLIKGMEMPKCCEECIFSIHDPTGGNSACAKMHQIILRKMNESIPRWCPLEEVPTPHGRLIDADKLKKRFGLIAEDDWNKTTATSWATAFRDAIDLVDEAPTIIEAEE